jgi:hypothetical protein
MKNVLFSWLISALAIYGSIMVETILPTLVLANVAVAFIGVGLAFGLKTPGIFMKAPNGRLAFLSYLIFWPYLGINQMLLRLYRLLSKESPVDEIIPGLYLGRRLWNTEKEKLIQGDICAVVDASAEWGEASFILKHCRYLCLLVLDTSPPTQEQLREGVLWIEKQLQYGGVFLHCAVGHGRSATIIAAYLLHAKVVLGVQEAIDFIKRKRPRINVNPAQISALKNYLDLEQRQSALEKPLEN